MSEDSFLAKGRAHVRASRRVVLAGAAVTPLVFGAAKGADTDVRKSHLRILAYGDSNTWGWRPTEKGFPTTRYDETVRWPRVVAALLGPRVEVLENGLNLRTTDLDDPIGSGDPEGQVAGADFNGLKALPAVLAVHAPLDLLVLALGQNDLQTPFERTATEIADAVANLAACVADSGGEVGTVYPPPSVLVVAPAPLPNRLHSVLGQRLLGAHVRSLGMSSAFAAMARKRSLALVDAGAVIGSAAGSDFRHYSEDQHRRLGSAIADEIRRMGLAA